MCLVGILRTDFNTINATFDWEFEAAALVGGEDAALAVLYAALIATALPANLALLAALFAARKRSRGGVPALLVGSVGGADVLVCAVVLPLAAGRARGAAWGAGRAACRASAFLQPALIAASVWALAALSAERCAAVRALPRRRPLSLSAARRLLASLWMAAGLLFAPLLLVADVAREPLPLPNNRTVWVEFCTEQWAGEGERQAFGVVTFLLVYLLPGCVVCVSYGVLCRRLCALRKPPGAASSGTSTKVSRGRVGAARGLAALAALFAGCWFPYSLLQLLLDLSSLPPELAPVLPYALLLGHSNCLLNPLVYMLTTHRARRTLRDMLSSRSNTTVRTRSLTINSPMNNSRRRQRSMSAHSNTHTFT